jgi:UPF0755 protein
VLHVDRATDEANARIRKARSGSVKAPAVYHPSAAHRRAARQFPTYDTSAIRPRHSKRRTAIVVVVIIILLAAAGVGGYYIYNIFAKSPSIEAGTPVSVTIEQGSTMTDIARKLKQVGVVTDETAFKNAVNARAAATQLKPGDYQLEAGMDLTGKLDELISRLVNGPDQQLNGYKLTVPEGLTIEQTADQVQQATGIQASEFSALAHKADRYQADYSFLSEVYDNSLEGFLYPKTYTVPYGSSADYVIRLMLDQFEAETAGLSLSYATDRNLSMYSVLVIASLIEKETALDDERPLIASVIYNRLHEDMPLQIDATVIYALGPGYDGHALLNGDLEVDSPYNTYKVRELPAGPICSPQLKSIKAAAAPAESDYLYYVLASKDGRHNFCATYEEFEAAKAAYEEAFGL